MWLLWLNAGFKETHLPLTFESLRARVLHFIGQDVDGLVQWDFMLSQF